MGFSLHEPFPTLSSSRPTYMHTGRGGAGNLHATTPSAISQRNPSTTSTLSPSTTSPYPRTSHKSSFLSGRGGAGNAHPLSERALFSFDEELERQGRAQQDAAPVYHIGRGGAGNLIAGGSVSEGSRKGSFSSNESEGVARRSLEWMRRLGSQEGKRV